MQTGASERPRAAKRLPGGWVTRAVLLLLASLTWTDFSSDSWIDLASFGGWVVVLAPLIPLAALCFGALPGAVGLLFALVMLNVFLRIGGGGYQVAQLLISTVVVGAFVAYMLPPRRARIFATIAATLIALTLVGRPTLEALYSTTMLLVFFALAVAAGLGMSIYRRRDARETARILELEEREARIRGEERMRLAHELHDIVAHDVTIIAMQARRAAVTDDTSKTASIIEGIGESAQQALNDMRSLVLLLKDDTPSPHQPEDLLDTPEASGETTNAAGLAHDLDSINDALDRAGFHTTLTIHGELARIPTGLRQALRRTARELGTNILKHADAAHPASLTLTITDHDVTITTRNTPTTHHPIPSSHTGLEAMNARATLLGGTLHTTHTHNTWTTTLTLPLTGTPVTATSLKETE